MKFYLHKSSWLPAIAFALVFISLWTMMALSTPSTEQNKQTGRKQTAYSLALPTIMAPVIRKEVNGNETEEVAFSGNVSRKISALLRIIVAIP